MIYILCIISGVIIGYVIRSIIAVRYLESKEGFFVCARCRDIISERH